MKQMMQLALAALLAAAGATANAKPRHMRPLPARQPAPADQAISAVTNPSLLPRAAAKGTAAGDTLQRISSIFINYGAGDDSVQYFYKSWYRGSTYDYSLDQQFYGYDGGFHYLQAPEAYASFDSLNYITRADHVSPYGPYLQTNMQYTADSVTLPYAGKTDRPNAAGVYGPSTRFTAVYTAAGDLAAKNNFAWEPSLLQYDTVFARTNSWYAPARLQTQENVYFTSPYPTRAAYSYRLRNYYTTGGLLYREDFLQYTPATGGYQTILSINLYAFTPSAKVASKIAYAGDSSITRYFYNASGQLIADSSYPWKASTHNWSTTVDEIHNYGYSGSTATAYATMKHYFNISSGIRLFDSSVQNFNSNGGLLFSGKYLFNPNNGDPGDFFTRSVSYNTAGRPVNMLSQEFYVGSDTASYYAGLTYNAAGNPVTRVSIWTDAYGNPEPDTFQNIHERYYYEAYMIPMDTIKPTGIGHAGSSMAVMKVFPNPADGELHLSCGAMSGAVMTITAGNGQVVCNHEIALGTGEAIIDVSTMAPGMYFVMLRDARSGLQATKPFIKR